MIYPTKDCKYDISVFCSNFHEIDGRLVELEQNGTGTGGSGLPKVTDDDNGKHLEVVDGEWAIVEQQGDVINKILDPDNYPLGDNSQVNTIVAELEFGSIGHSDGVLWEDEETYLGLRTADYIPVKSGTLYTVTYDESQGRMAFLFYDSSYGFLTGWNGEYNYYYLSSGDEIEAPSGAAYMKAHQPSATSKTGTLEVSDGKIGSTKAEHKKIYIADHGYSIYGDIIDDETMHKIVIEAEGKDDNTFNIVEVKAPTRNPKESTIALMNWGNGFKQFVDFSSMVYDPDNPTVEIVCQTRGGEKLPEFSVRYNNGEGAGRVKKFVVQPDAIPMELTSEGVRIRKNNNFDNDGAEEDFVTIDLIKQTLPGVSEADNDKILKVVDGKWSATSDVLLEEQPLTFAPSADFGGQNTSMVYLPGLEAGKNYSLVWEGTEYQREAIELQLGSMTLVGFGNEALLGLGANTGEPFLIGAMADGTGAIITALEAPEYWVGVYEYDPQLLPRIADVMDDGKILMALGGRWVPITFEDSGLKSDVEAIVDEYIATALGGDY